MNPYKVEVKVNNWEKFQELSQKAETLISQLNSVIEEINSLKVGLIVNSSSQPE